MEETHLYQQVAESIRRDILDGKLQPGERLPSVRQLCSRWSCTPGTIQRAYNELARQGLLVSRAGQGTQVAGELLPSRIQAEGTLRRANLVHRSEAFLLEVLTAGYELDEIQQALDLAMDRWRSLSADQAAPPDRVVRFAGSHDMVLNGLAHDFFGRILPDVALQLRYNGSMGGLMELREGKADLAGCHLWDEESGTYNLPFIHRLFPGEDLVVVTLAHRRLGLIVASGNPHQITGLAGLQRQGIRFVNRQDGSGTRVWLDARLEQMNIAPESIQGYSDERLTHSDVARVVAEGGADVGLGLETAALAYGLDFIFLTRERYDLVMLPETAEQPPAQKLIQWLGSTDGKRFVAGYRGYDSEATGQIVRL